MKTSLQVVIAMVVAVAAPDRPARIGFAAEATAPAAVKTGGADADFFESKIRPLFHARCKQCHGDKKQEMGLRVDRREAFFRGGDDGPVVVPGDPEKSLLIEAVQHKGDIQMPPDAKLPDEEIAALTTWVKLGAPWPDDPHADGPTAPSTIEAAKNHWAFQPVRRPEMPNVQNAAWVQSPIDRFVLTKLEAAGLQPSPPADRHTLIRRATFDLLGLPPTPEEVEAFVADESPYAFERLVDRLLESPHYGERWGRYWLDVARYADTKGYLFTEDRNYPFAYAYRDWVVRSLNQDLPYDQFLLQQIAADRLPRNDDLSLAAMGFLTLGRRFLNNKHDIIDDRLDAVFRGTQALTVSCARCHDHKYDPIPTDDYYSLYGVFADSVETTVPLEPPTDEYREGLTKREAARNDFIAEQRAEISAKMKAKSETKELTDAKLKKLLSNKAKKKFDKLQTEVMKWKTSDKAPQQAHVLNDGESQTQPRVLVRGNPRNPGRTVPKQFPAAVVGENRTPFHEGSGRLEMARLIASPQNPLTARVMVNRVWMYHFAAPLVETPSDFGTRSEPPTHPELLDFLAAEFVADGWSLKKLHRKIMLSAAYQQASFDRPECEAVDPINHLLWKMNRRRLDWEGLRDAIAAVSGSLDLTVGGKAFDMFAQPFTLRRTIYGHIDRQNLPGVLRTFDFALPDTHSPRRFTTTVPPQALYLMNNAFVVEQAERLARRDEIAAVEDETAQMQKMYAIVFGRPATKNEVALAQEFLKGNGGDDEAKLNAWDRFAQALLMTNEFVYID